jgi:hypothetical protein
MTRDPSSTDMVRDTNDLISYSENALWPILLGLNKHQRNRRRVATGYGQICMILECNKRQVSNRRTGVSNLST